MRVLHLFDWYLPSTLSWVSRLLTHIPDAEIEVAAPWIVPGEFYHSGLRHYTFPPQRWFFPGIASEWDFPVAQRLFARSQRFLPSYPWWLERQLRRNPPDILHAHFGPTGCLYLPLAKKINRPLVVTFYGFDYQKILLQRPVFRRKYRELFAAANRIIAAGPTGCAALEALGCPAAKLAIVRPSPDLKSFPFQPRQKRAGQLRLLQAATFTAKKGYLTTLEAFRRALPDCPNLHLTLAGEPYDRALVRQVAEYLSAHGLRDRVEWLAPVPHAHMPELFARFDAFIHPSRTTPDGDHEATPVVLLEAQASGLPVLTTNHFDLADAVQHGRTGWLVPENDAPALAYAIRRFYDMDSATFENYSRNARQWVEEFFHIERSAAQLRSIYDSLTDHFTH